MTEPKEEIKAPSRVVLIARLVVALSLAALFVTAAMLAWEWEPRVLPIQRISVAGEAERLSRDDLREKVVSVIERGMLTQNLAPIQEAVAELPWVAKVSVRRHWPDRIELTMVEHRAYARFGESGLVTAAGVVFHPRDERIPQGLARLRGDELDAPRLVRAYHRWRTRFAGLGIEITEVELDARGAWRLRLASGIDIELGTSDLDVRIDRFLGTYRQLLLAGFPDRIDLRYSNGLAVRWGEWPDEPVPGGVLPTAGNESDNHKTAAKRS